MSLMWCLMYRDIIAFFVSKVLLLGGHFRCFIAVDQANDGLEKCRDEFDDEGDLAEVVADGPAGDCCEEIDLTPLIFSDITDFSVYHPILSAVRAHE